MYFESTFRIYLLWFIYQVFFLVVPNLKENNGDGKSVGCILLGSTPVGFFCLTDVCRTGAKEALSELKSMGIKTVMLTGDCYAAAKLAQDQVSALCYLYRQVNRFNC